MKYGSNQVEKFLHILPSSTEFELTYYISPTVTEQDACNAENHISINCCMHLRYVKFDTRWRVVCRYWNYPTVLKPQLWHANARGTISSALKIEFTGGQMRQIRMTVRDRVQTSGEGLVEE